MSIDCDMCKFVKLSFTEAPCKTCVHNALFNIRDGVDNWQPATLEALFDAAKPYKPRRKELQATIDELTAKVGEIGSELVNVTLERDALKRKLAATVMQRNASRVVAAPPALLPVGTRVSVEGVIVTASRCNDGFPYYIEFYVYGGKTYGWFEDGQVKKVLP